MKLPFYTTTLVGVGVAVAMRLAADAAPEPASWCFTYLSDILVPLSALQGNSAPTEIAAQTPTLSALSESQPGPETLNLTSPAPASSLPPTPITVSGSGSSPSPSFPALRQIILFIYPSVGDRRRKSYTRANTGFLNNDVAERQQQCNNATVFTLASGQLSDSGSPIYYFPGDSYKELRSAGPLPYGAISTNFTIDKGVLEFSNSSLPGGEASFCEDATTGNIYLTFTSSPLNCVAVFLTSYGVELCQNGEIVGADAPRAGSTRRTEAGQSLSTSASRSFVLAPEESGLFSQPYDAPSEYPATSPITSPRSTGKSPITSLTSKALSPSTTSTLSAVESTSGDETMPPGLDKSSHSPASFLGTSLGDQTGPSKTRDAESTTSTTSRPGIDISLSLSPITSQEATPSPQKPSPLLSSTYKLTPSTGRTVEKTGSRGPSSEREPSTAPSTGSSPAEQTTSVPTNKPMPMCGEGLEYAVYVFKYGSPECAALGRTTKSGDPLSLDLAAVIERKTPATTGRYPGLDLSDASIDDQCAAVVLRGYIVLNETGQYTLSILGTVYDLLYVWHGDAALSGRFEPGNSALREFRDSTQGAITSATFVESLSTRYMPIRVFIGSPTLFIGAQISAKSPSHIDASLVTCSTGEIAPVWESWEQQRVGARNTFSTSDVSSVTRGALSITPSTTPWEEDEISETSSTSSASSTDDENSIGTSSSTAPSAPTEICEEGLEYAIYIFSTGSPEFYTLDYMVHSSNPLSLDLEALIENKIPEHTGTTETVEWASDDETSPIAIYDFSAPNGETLSDTCLIVQNRGFVKFHGPGTYTFEIVGDPDTVLFVWFGNEALSGTFYAGNSELVTLYQSIYSSSTTHQVTVSDTDSNLPIRVFYANLIGPGAFKLSITGPADAPSPSLVQCPGTGDAPDWLPWAEEDVGSLLPD